jgi:aspartate aminotransferase-like enzyme/predicted N-acetyltransferase YhbS
LRLAGPEDEAAVAELNYRTFVQELGQYTDDGSGLRQDKFHGKNHYMLCEREGELVGMVAVHDQPPFSVSARLPDGQTVESLSKRPLEVRLLSVRPDLRRGPLAMALMYSVLRFARENHYQELWISGVTGQRRLYTRLGFETLGPSVPQGKAAFAPMRMRISEIPESKMRLLRATLRRNGSFAPAGVEGPLQSWLPGPPRLAAPVAAALKAPPLYHRSPAFLDAFRDVRDALSNWMDGMNIAPWSGSGTAANDALACWIARAPETRGQRGLLLTNGEFGERLAGHARAAGLDFEVLQFPWCQPWDVEQVLGRVDAGGYGWVWGVQLETSTGALNPAAKLQRALQTRGVPLALDAISALGAVPLPTGTWAASGVSGKALGALAGLCWVGARPDPVDHALGSDWPPSLDLPQQWRSAGPCHTLPSPQLASLRAALYEWTPAERRTLRFERYAELGRRIRTALRDVDLEPLVAEEHASPVVTTFAVPDGTSTEEYLSQLRGSGHQLAGASSYLQERDWAQIATFGEVDDADLAGLLKSLD